MRVSVDFWRLRSSSKWVNLKQLETLCETITYAVLWGSTAVFRITHGQREVPALGRTDGGYSQQLAIGCPKGTFGIGPNELHVFQGQFPCFIYEPGSMQATDQEMSGCGLLERRTRARQLQGAACMQQGIG
jgi:hypothetical protein